jgi:hypothetical protein
MTARRRSPRAAVTTLAAVVMALATAQAAADPDPADGPDADAHITLVPDPAVLAPEAHESSIRIVLSGPGPALAAPPRLFVNVGHVDEPRRTGDRSFVTRFHAPEVHFPQIAIVAAEAAPATAVTPVRGAAVATKSLARGFSTVALRAAAQPSFRTEAGARVTVRVGGEEFGPVTAGDDGQARIPIVVSPGSPTAHVRAIDPRGRSSERDVDLKPPRFPQLLLLAPNTLPAGGTVELGLIGIAADGTPIDDRRLVLRSSYLRPHPLGPVDHVARYLVRVPPRIDAGPLRLTARLRADPAPDGDERDDLDLLEASLPLRPGPLARLTLAPHQSRLTVSGDDPWGQPVPIEGVEIYVNGQPAQLEHQGPDRAIVVFDTGLPSLGPPAARARRLGPGLVEIEAVLDGVYTRYQLPRGAITGAGATLALPAGTPSETIAITAAMGMVWPRGPGFGVEARADVDGRPDWLPRRLHLGAGVVYLGTRGSASDDLGQSAISIDQVLLLGRAGGRLAVGRRIECALSVGAGIAYSQVRNQVYRLRLTDRQAGPAAELGVEAGAALGRGAIILAARYLRVPLDTLSRGDVIRGTGGGLVFDLGYRLRF